MKLSNSGQWWFGKFFSNLTSHIFWVVICRAWSYLEATHWPSKCQTYLFCNSSNHHWAMSNISNDSMTVQLFRLAGFRRTIFRPQIFVRRLRLCIFRLCISKSAHFFVRTFSASSTVQTKNAGQKNTPTKNAPNQFVPTNKCKTKKSDENLPTKNCLTKKKLSYGILFRSFKLMWMSSK